MSTLADRLVALCLPRTAAVRGPVDWGEALRDSLSEAQRAALSRTGSFLVTFPRGVKRLRVYENGSTGFCIRPSDPPPSLGSEDDLVEEGHPWVAYQMMLWAEVRPDLFFRVANSPLHTKGETIRDRQGHRRWPPAEEAGA